MSDDKPWGREFDDERLEAVVAERLTASGKFWAEIGIDLVKMAKACRGKRSRAAIVEYIKVARGCFKTAIESDRTAEIEEVRRLADALEKMHDEADTISDL